MPEKKAGGATPKRTLRISKSDWQRLKARAEACGMNVTQYVVHRLAGPDPDVAVPRPDPAEILARLEMLVRFLCEVERARLLADQDPKAVEAFKALVRRAEEHVRRERKFE